MNWDCASDLTSCSISVKGVCPDGGVTLNEHTVSTRVCHCSRSCVWLSPELCRRRRLCKAGPTPRLACREDSDAVHFCFVRSYNNSKGRLPANSKKDLVPRQRGSRKLLEGEKYNWMKELGRVQDNVRWPVQHTRPQPLRGPCVLLAARGGD